MLVQTPTGPEVEPFVLQVLTGDRVMHRQRIFREVIQLGGYSPEQLAVKPPASNKGRFNSRIEYTISSRLSHLKKRGVVINNAGYWKLNP